MILCMKVTGQGIPKLPGLLGESLVSCASMKGVLQGNINTQPATIHTQVTGTTHKEQILANVSEFLCYAQISWLFFYRKKGGATLRFKSEMLT